jgi:hypothetical protein
MGYIKEVEIENKSTEIIDLYFSSQVQTLTIQASVAIDDLTYSDKAPAGFYGMRVRRSFNGPDKNDVVIELEKDTSDELQLIIQDNLTGLTSFKIVAQGHRVD